MKLDEAYKATRIIESLENYAIIQENNCVPINGKNKSKNISSYPPNINREFWRSILIAPDDYWGATFSFNKVTLSDWIPRVPGLYFSKGADATRLFSRNYIAIKGSNRFELKPPGKSADVLGGVGEFVLPQDTFGNRMMSIISNDFFTDVNASTGIPVLISNDVWDHHSLQHGDCLTINNAKWTKLPAEWAQRFASIKGIPRGCIALNDINQEINKIAHNYPIEFHPFTIMQYEYKNSLLYDYVYLNVNTHEKKYRSKMEQFFEYYRLKEGRNGKYLIQFDMNNPLFETIYNTPDELLKQNQYGESQIRLITKRLKNIYFKGKTINDLIEFISSYYYQQDDLSALCLLANISPGIIAGNSVAEKTVVLVDYCIEKGIVEQLIDSISIKHPTIAFWND
jgi:hypothetical protein